MMAKYEKVKKDVIDYIHNQVLLKTKRRDIVNMVCLRFPVFVAFFKVDREMLKEIVRWMHDSIYHEVRREHYDNERL